MTPITPISISSTTSQLKGITDLQREPYAFSNMLSFLTDPEKQTAELISKQWQKHDAIENGYGDFLYRRGRSLAAFALRKF